MVSGCFSLYYDGMRFLLLCCLFWGNLVLAAPLKIAVLHPLLQEMAESLGKDQVEVVNLLPEYGSLHEFAPSPREITDAAGSQLVLACGKGLEPYLTDLEEALPAKSRLLKLGDFLPDAFVPGVESLDPHWWNSPGNMKRASRVLLQTMIQIDPERAVFYRNNQRVYAGKMDALDREARLLLNHVPASARVLVTEHAAMCHFCVAYGFQPLALHGVSRESEGDTATIAYMLRMLREKHVRCLFFEAFDSPRDMQVIAKQVGARISDLILDGYAPGIRSYESLFRYNVRHIAEGLGEPEH